MPKWKELLKYCKKNEWELKSKSKHFHYIKMLNNGEVLRTMISKSLSKEIPKRTFKDILKQLRITKEEFNRKS